ncbi:flagellar export chaperone FliS [Paradesulfitobacterium aromaticivorans]
MLNSQQVHNQYEVYRQRAVETASPAKLLIMLYDGAIRFLQQGKAALEAGDFEKANAHLLKVQDILSELIVSLDLSQGEIAENLYQLYDFYLHEVIKANIEKKAAYLEPVEDFLRGYRDMWIEAAKKAG